MSPGAELRRRLRLLLALALACVAFTVTPRASAYGWMMRHDYPGCVQCHADPSGGALLTPYGRAQGEVLLRTRYPGEGEEPTSLANFAFGLVPTPDWLLLGGTVREAYFDSKPEGTRRRTDLFTMQLDLLGEVRVSRVRANASLGYAPTGAQLAAITTANEKNLVSRTHWLGVSLDDEERLLLRGGRMNLPFGLRSVEHTFLARSATRTDRNASQQLGASLAYSGRALRGEAMLIAGNYQLAPDAYRDRGYSAYLEWNAAPRLGLGASSLVVHADKDLQSEKSTFRQAHGLFARYSPLPLLYLSTEVDLLYQTTKRMGGATGVTGLVQADVEPLQGVHLVGTGEMLSQDVDKPATYGAWATVNWFFAPHADARVDLIYQDLAAGSTRLGVVTWFLQLHLYL